MKLCRYAPDRVGVIRGSAVHDVSAIAEKLPKHGWPYPTHDVLIAQLPALRAEIAPRKPVSVEYSKITESGVERIRARLTSVFESGEANGALREAGIFTAASGGVMYNRVKFDTVTKTADFKLTLIWDVVF